MSDRAVPGRRVFLVGLMGSGKTTVARALQQTLGWPVVDNDTALAAGTGRSVVELAAAGPEALHHLEGLQLDLAAGAPGPLLVTVAASIADDEHRLAAIGAAGAVVYLRVPAAVLAARVTGSARPWLVSDQLALMESMTHARGPRLEAAADLVVDAGQGRPADQAAQIVEALNLRR